jgi:hypothetical protein
MTDAVLSSAVLVRVADFLRDLPVEQLTALARGDAALAVVGPTRPHATVIPVRSPVPATTVRAALSGMTDRASAGRYVDDLRLTTPQLRSLAKELGLAVSASASKASVRDTIVHWTVGRRIDAAVLSRPRS